jgi:hypothetical protein
MTSAANSKHLNAERRHPFEGKFFFIAPFNALHQPLRASVVGTINLVYYLLRGTACRYLYTAVVLVFRKNRAS